eukprot:171508_1
MTQKHSLSIVLLILLTNLNPNHAWVKTGIAISANIEDINCDDFSVLTSPTWWYNWHTLSTYQQKNCTQNGTNIEFIPMIWGWSGQNLSQTPIPDDATTIIGFNEPNLISQANLQPAAAVEAWKQLQTVFDDKILVSPSASPCSGEGCIVNFGSQTDWFDEFFRLCNGECRVDYLAVHFYWCYLKDSDKNVYDWLGSLHNLYTRYGYKLWLTEFNCWDGTVAEQNTFLDDVLPVLDSTDWIAKYAWFMARERNTGHDTDMFLFTNNTHKAELTELGETYNTRAGVLMDNTTTHEILVSLVVVLVSFQLACVGAYFCIFTVWF